VKPFEYPLLADENIHPAVVSGLRSKGASIQSASELKLLGANDERVLNVAHLEGRVVLTHDHDFGRLALASGAQVIGIVFLRPGHIQPQFVLEMIDTARAVIGDVEPPFLITIERRADRVRIRVRRTNE